MAKVSFSFATGRTYGATQHIVGVYELYSADEFGFCDMRVIFGDDVRNIYGAFVIPVHESDNVRNFQRYILAQYDVGKYEYISYAEYVAAQA